MRKISLVPNMLTAFSLACGLFVIFKLNMVEPGADNYQILVSCVLLLLLAGLADVLDGAVARAMHAESEFGVLFDSFADSVSFGVAPSVLVLKSLSLEQGTGLSFFAVAGAMLFSLCGILRLVRFSLKTYESKNDPKAKAAQKKNFTGLPIPAGALAAVSVNLLLASPLIGEYYPALQESRAIVLPIVMLVLGFFMVSNWKFPSLKTLHFRLPSFYLISLTALLALFILYGIFYFLPVILTVCMWGYIMLGWVLSVIRLIAGKKSKTLEDFEPDPED
jgi:CDP-diacylglycerol---serine O-phosphatidyltransferase